MYRHRPDATSFGFGLAFVIIALSTLLDPGRDIAVSSVVAGSLAMAVGISLIGRLLLGDVHRAAAERLAAGHGPLQSLPNLTTTPLVDDVPLHLDPLFGSPIDPDTLDREFRDRFGDGEPASKG